MSPPIYLFQLSVIAIEAIVTATLLLILFRIRRRFGLSPLYVALGVFQPMQVILASSFYVEVAPGLVVSPGSVVMFSATLFAVLLVYILEDAVETRKVVYGILLANLTVTLLIGIFGANLGRTEVVNHSGLPPDVLRQNLLVILTGTLVLFLDSVLIIFVYERLWKRLRRNLFLHIYLAGAAVLIVDSLLFYTAAFSGYPNFQTILVSGIVGKLGTGVVFAAAATAYLRFLEPFSNTAKPFRDFFETLTYRQKYEAERHRGEETQVSLLESEQRYRDLFDSSPVALWEGDYSAARDILDQVGLIGEGPDRVLAILAATPELVRRCADAVRVTAVNRQCLSLYRAPSGLNLLGGGDLLLADPSHALAARQLAAVAAGEHQLRSEAQIRAHDGEWRNLEVYWNLLPGAREPHQRVLVAMVDVTDRIQAEKAREHLQTQLMQAQKMESVGRLAGGVAHDFNNLLGVIIGCTELAMEDGKSDDGQQHNLLETALDAAVRSAEITSQLLAFARRQTASPRLLDLNQAASGSLKIVRRMTGEEISLQLQLGDGLWPVTMDPVQLDQILTNLCVNARDAIAGVGTITVTTRNVSLDRPTELGDEGSVTGDFVALEVTDSGCGMDPETLGAIFEPFFTTKGPTKGTGLGLATVYGIVKQNHGHISVDSEVGAGTTFTVYLPKANEASAPDIEAPVEVPIGGGSETVMVVEDEVTNLLLFKAMLERLGYAVLCASSPSDAVRVAEAHSKPIHLLLTDVVMPEMNGCEVAHRVAALHPETKTLFMSGYPDEVIAQRGLLRDNIRLLHKPFTIGVLATQVRATLGPRDR